MCRLPLRQDSGSIKYLSSYGEKVATKQTGKILDAYRLIRFKYNDESNLTFERHNFAMAVVEDMRVCTEHGCRCYRYLRFMSAYPAFRFNGLVHVKLVTCGILKASIMP